MAAKHKSSLGFKKPLTFVGVFVCLISGSCGDPIVAPDVNDPPNKPWNESPKSDGTGVSVGTTLTWQSSDPDGDPVTHAVLLDTIRPPADTVATDIADNFFKPNEDLVYDEEYYWRVIVKDTAGHETVGDVWAFRTGSNRPPTVVNTSPVNLATDLNPRTLQLVWNATDPEEDQLVYDVILDTLASPVDTVARGITEPRFSPLGLIYGKKYYWYVIARDDYGNRSSSLGWSFSTSPPIEMPEVCHETVQELYGIAKVGPQVMYVVGAGTGLSIASVISDECHVSQLYGPAFYLDVAVLDNHIFLASNSYGFQIVSVSGELEGGCETAKWSNAIAVEGDYAYVANRNSGLIVFDVRNPVSVPCPGDSLFPSIGYGGKDIAIGLGTAYLTTGAGVTIVDVTNPKDLVEIAYYDCESPAWGTALAGSVLYVAAVGRLIAVDVTNPRDPQTLGTAALPEISYFQPDKISVDDSWVYVSHFDGVVRVFDVQDAEHPRFAGYGVATGRLHAAAVDANHVYVVGESGLTVFDKSPLER